MICGHARHGKDTLAEMLNAQWGYGFQSSSEYANDTFIYERLRHKYDYDSPAECFDDRVNHRKEWYDLICEYNEGDKTRLARGIYENSDIYVGIRDIEEFIAAGEQKLFDFSIWVDASERLPAENVESCSVTPEFCDVIFDNNDKRLHGLDTTMVDALHKWLMFSHIGAVTRRPGRYISETNKI